ncbi:MAG: DUF4177 domain-containing protein [Clostridiaceae bacterium]
MTWEYKTVSLDSFQSEAEGMSLSESLNNFGMEGWELVTLIKADTDTLGIAPLVDKDTLVFKRSR